MLTGACAGRLLARGPAGGAARSGVPRFWSRELGQAHLFLRVDCQRLIAKGKWKESFLFICKWKSDEDRASLHQRFHFQSRGFQKGGRPWGGRRARPGPRAFPRQPGPARPLVQATCLVWKVRTCRGHTRAAARPRLSVRRDRRCKAAMPNSWQGLERVCKFSSLNRWPREISQQQRLGAGQPPKRAMLSADRQCVHSASVLRLTPSGPRAPRTGSGVR